jgi:hypothetical protein
MNDEISSEINKYASKKFKMKFIWKRIPDIVKNS